MSLEQGGLIYLINDRKVELQETLFSGSSSFQSFARLTGWWLIR